MRIEAVKRRVPKEELGTRLTVRCGWTYGETVVFGEAANFAAYAFAPATLVTPLGALSILVTAVLAHFFLKEKLNIFGWVGCILCIVGSTTIVVNAPEERMVQSVQELWSLAMQPEFLIYAFSTVATILFLIFYVAPLLGATNMLVYIGICSLVGSLSVMSCKVLGIALKLTLSGNNQFVYPQTYLSLAVVAVSVITQMNYLNKALDLFNTAVVTPFYYVLFTMATVLASVIMFKDWEQQTGPQIVSVMCGFSTILCGTFMLHATKDVDLPNLNSWSSLLHLPRGGGPVQRIDLAKL